MFLISIAGASKPHLRQFDAIISATKQPETTAGIITAKFKRLFAVLSLSSYQRLGRAIARRLHGLKSTMREIYDNLISDIIDYSSTVVDINSIVISIASSVVNILLQMDTLLSTQSISVEISVRYRLLVHMNIQCFYYIITQN